MIRQLLPKLLDYTTTYGNTLAESVLEEAVPGVVLTEGFLTLLSAVLERNTPKQEFSAPITGTGSGRIGSSASRLSTSALSSTHSLAVEDTSLYTVREREREREAAVSLPRYEEEEEVEGVSDDGLSECSDLHAHLLMNLQHQMGSMCLFALIWSFGAYLPSYQ